MREQDIKVGDRYIYNGVKIFRVLSIDYDGRRPTCSLWFENENRGGRTAYPLFYFKKDFWLPYKTCAPIEKIIKHKFV